jgi:ammonia channel protein AmtB
VVLLRLGKFGKHYLRSDRRHRRYHSSHWLDHVHSRNLRLALAGALFGCVAWLFVNQGWLSLDSDATIAWVVLTILSLILAAGMSWSHVRRRASGQFDVEEDRN